MDCQGALDKVSRAHRAYEEALAEAERRRELRDQAVLEATEAGATRAVLGRQLGLTRARIQQIIERGRASGQT